MRKLNAQYRYPPAELFKLLADYAEKHEISSDNYGRGEYKQKFESELADHFGYEAAVFMPSGVMAQLIALRIACDQKNTNTVAFHSTSHLEKHEEMAYSELHQLESVLVGAPNSVIKLVDLEKLPSSPAALIYELPMRHLGAALPEWDELSRIKQYCADQKIHLHIDGARIWETQAYYQKNVKEVCAGSQSCYVSFYKGIGSTAGAMLMGDQEFIEQAKIWQRRHGGNLCEMSSLLVPAKFFYDQHRNDFSEYYKRAQAIAKIVHSIEGMKVDPMPIQCNMMHILIEMDPKELGKRFGELNKKLGYDCSMGMWGKDENEAKYTRCELYVAKCALEISDQEIESYFGQIIPSHS